MKLSNLEIALIKSYRFVSYPVYSVLDMVHLNIFQCRYTPCCSVYAEEAIRKYGSFTGTIMALKRISRCRLPYGGDDPVN